MTEQERVLAGGGEMGALMRSMDWSQNPLGPVESWPPALRTSVGLMLGSPHVVCVLWGPDFIMLYNDGYRHLIGDKHPAALGRAAQRNFAESWDFLGPVLDGVVRTQTHMSPQNQIFFLDRRGFIEEAYFSPAFIPLRDEHGRCVGVLSNAFETTPQVLGERRFKCIRELSNHTAHAHDTPGVLRVAEEVLSRNGSDVPFALLYRMEGDTARLTVRSGLEEDTDVAPRESKLGDNLGPWPLAEVLHSGEERLVEDLGSRGRPLHAGPWPEPVNRALLLPLSLGGSGEPDSVLILGLSPRLPLDEGYRDFLQLLSRQVVADIARVHALEQEKQRAAQLAEIDRVKTAFFSNVSHEFRTPLTLMLGPTENALASPEQALRGEDLRRVHRNELRLLKLVNTLLDLSRLEAGRTQGRFAPTDLGPFTAGLASAFDSLTAKAGLRLMVDCPPLPEPVWVDPDMWEKIVLNLVSNAFKFTNQGQIAVHLRWQGTQVELSVEDTGTGIAPEQQPRVFERFHRVEGARGRTDEGTGIGLSLVRELVELHGGSVRVDSTPGQGSTFTVSLPTGQAHLPRERVVSEPPRVSTATGSEAFLQEAEQWLDPAVEDAEEKAPQTRPGEAPLGHVLLVDDNADMRDYMRRLLQSRFRVEAVADGWAALAAARAHPPDVVVSDVMMPGLDGFGLVRELKADARTEHVPVMLISARASEKATLEGFSAGIVDYMVKPFKARELLARTEAIVRAAQAQAESRRLLAEVEAARGRLSGLLENSPGFVAALAGPEHIFQVVNPPYQKLVGEGRELLGRTVEDALPEVVEQGFIQLLDRVYHTREPLVGREVPVKLKRREDGGLEEAFLNLLYQPRYDARGQVEGIDVFGFEVTEQVQTREQLRDRLDFEQKLLGIVSHDLRNPLSAILMGTALLAKREDMDPRATKSLVRIQSSAERATRMVKDLLDFTQARIGGGLQIAPHAMDLHLVARGVVEEVEVAYPTRVLEVKHEGDGQGEWDADRMAQVLQNLITNALKYSPEDSRVRVGVRGEKERVVLSVANGGKPIPADKLVSIFEPMQRATAEIDKAGRSVGLGLYIVKGIVDAHGGRVSVTSTEEEGTVFSVSLPRQRT